MTMKAWYIRCQQNEIKGPFPKGQIAQEILLGRYKLDCEVSHDKEEWLPLRRVPELIPDVLKGDRSDPQFNEKVAAARRWADERRGAQPVARQERRHGESVEMQTLHRMREELQQGQGNSPVKLGIQLIVIVLVVFALIQMAFKYAPATRQAKADCSAAAAPGVNWANCDLSGVQLLRAKLTKARLNSAKLQGANLFAADLTAANLSYAELQLANLSFADFSGANLKGAILTNADLSQAKLVNADLSYVNLKQAKIDGAMFNNTQLDNAIWIDGRTCAAGSLGECR